MDLDGIWLQVLAVSTERQDRGAGQEAYALAVDRLRSVEKDGDHLAGLVHVDNVRSKRFLTKVGWTVVSTSSDQELWAGRL